MAVTLKVTVSPGFASAGSTDVVSSAFFDLTRGFVSFFFGFAESACTGVAGIRSEPVKIANKHAADTHAAAGQPE